MSHIVLEPSVLFAHKCVLNAPLPSTTPGVGLFVVNAKPSSLCRLEELGQRTDGRIVNEETSDLTKLNMLFTT